MTAESPKRCKLGIILPEAENDMGGRTARWRDYLEMAGLAEDIELGSVDPATCIDDRRSCQDPVISRRRVEE